MRLLCSLALALVYCAAAVWAAVSADQVKAVFGTTDGLQSGTAKLSVISSELAVVANTSHALVVLTMTDASMDKVGWVALGLGTTMADADEIFAWPNSDYTWTLSHRAGAAMTSPSDLGADSTGDFQLVPALSSGDSSSKTTQVAWMRKLKATYTSPSKNLALSSGSSVIYARASTNPEDCKNTVTAPAFHDLGYGAASITFTTAVSGDVGTGSAVTGGGKQAVGTCTATGALSAKAGSGSSSPAPAPPPGSPAPASASGGGNGTAPGPAQPVIDQCTIPTDSPYAAYSSFICPTGSSVRHPLYVPYFLALLVIAVVVSNPRRYPP